MLTGLAQLRFAASLVFGVPFSPWMLERLVDAVRQTQHEFGAVGASCDNHCLL